jgi:diguanylate cyclase (GGDEF)-like protein
MFADFYRNEMQTSGIDIVLFGILNGIIYLGLRFFSNAFEPIYQTDNQSIVYWIYFLNTLFAFSFFILFIYIYNRAVSRMENDLRQMAERDPLTGLYNRRRMLQFMEQAMTEVAETPFAVAMLDIDYFKKVNDTYGHDAGDEVLKTFAKILTTSTFDKDTYFASRWGGEEFVVLYRCENNLDTIKEIFETLRHKIEEKTIYYGEYKIHITATIGVLTCNTPCEVKELIKEVDDLLYEGKNSGRNMVMSK